MNITVNGMRGEEVSDSTSVAELLSGMNIDPARSRGIAVAVNEKIVRRNYWGKTMLAEGDCVEIVTAQQGG